MGAHFDPNYENPTKGALEYTLVVSARDGFSIEGLKDLGYKVVRPYRDRGLFGRALREVWFRLGLPESAWYSGMKGIQPRDVIVHDPLVTRGFLDYLITVFPDARIHFQYWNLVGNAKHLYPREIPPSIHIWTFDRGDADRYGVNYLQSAGYPTMFMRERESVDSDLLFIGSDKGRADGILELQSELNDLGISTDFRIMPDGRFSKRKNFYSRPMPYTDIASLVVRSKGVLNMCMPNQAGATMRDYESAFNQVKLVTNNKHAKSFIFYKPENVFILGESPICELPMFLDTPFSPIDREILRKCTLNASIEHIIDTEF